MTRARACNPPRSIRISPSLNNARRALHSRQRISSFSVTCTSRATSFVAGAWLSTANAGHSAPFLVASLIVVLGIRTAFAMCAPIHGRNAHAVGVSDVGHETIEGNYPATRCQRTKPPRSTGMGQVTAARLYSPATTRSCRRTTCATMAQSLTSTWACGAKRTRGNNGIAGSSYAIALLPDRLLVRLHDSSPSLRARRRQPSGPERDDRP
jgi:hypothetical protein